MHVFGEWILDIPRVFINVYIYRKKNPTFYIQIPIIRIFNQLHACILHLNNEYMIGTHSSIKTYLKTLTFYH